MYESVKIQLLSSATAGRLVYLKHQAMSDKYKDRLPQEISILV